jgi:hypothetical protein
VDRQQGRKKMLPSFLKSLRDESVKNVFFTGCGGGFDFLHCMNLYKELRDNSGKNIVIGYSFNSPDCISGGEIVFQRGAVGVCKVNGSCSSSQDYQPEISLCRYLDQEYPADAPHFIYAYYARDFGIPLLRELYEFICDTQSIDAIVCMDGGSDSLMVGDEDGLGDPIEDAVSVGAISSLTCESVTQRYLLVIGLGADRFNDVSDASSLRAIAELTAAGAFRGAVCMEPDSEGFMFYKHALQFIYAHQSFQSVLSSSIVCSVEGAFGADVVPEFAAQSQRVKPGEMFLWPISGIIWAFDIAKVYERSKLIPCIEKCSTQRQCYIELDKLRTREGLHVRGVEQLPRHEDYSCVKKSERLMQQDPQSDDTEKRSEEKNRRQSCTPS